MTPLENGSGKLVELKLSEEAKILLYTPRDKLGMALHEYWNKTSGQIEAVRKARICLSKIDVDEGPDKPDPVQMAREALENPEAKIDQWASDHDWSSQRWPTLAEAAFLAKNLSNHSDEEGQRQCANTAIMVLERLALVNPPGFQGTSTCFEQVLDRLLSTREPGSSKLTLFQQVLADKFKDHRKPAPAFGTKGPS